MIRMLKLMWAAWIGCLEFITAEAASDVKRLEAARNEEWHAEMKALGLGERERDEVRSLAVDLLKLGVTADDVPELARMWHVSRFLSVTTEDVRAVAEMRERWGRDRS